MYTAFSVQKKNAGTKVVVPQPHRHNGAEEARALAQIECAVSGYQIRMALSPLYVAGQGPSRWLLKQARRREKELGL